MLDVEDVRPEAEDPSPVASDLEIGPAEYEGPAWAVGLTTASYERHRARCSDDVSSRAVVASMPPLVATVVMEVRLVIFCMAYHACRIVKGRWLDLWVELGVNEDARLNRLATQDLGAEMVLRLLSSLWVMHKWPAPAGFDWARISAIFNGSFSATEMIRTMGVGPE